MSHTTRIQVWDPLIRLFHWTLVVSFVIAYVSEDDFLNLHVLAGYYISGLLIVRVIWGLVGSRYARFTNFIYAPATVKQYLSDLVHLRARSYLGHNPAGGAMVLAMLLSLSLTVISGLITYGAEEQAGPLLVWVSDWNGGLWEELHELFANLSLLLVVLHILGVIVSSLLHGENLIRSMWTGNKEQQE